jgi:polyribonucleotide nucleotidyltransferase
LHYNFPPFSVGDVRPIRGPGRREIGHGNLAERSLQNIIPSEETFPYTIRIVSEILESNGSSSMATVCSGSLSLMDAGIPIKTHVAGIAMGLVIENGKHAILTDIKGSEDHYGDMDFKVTGTEKGINAFQMDVKVPGISFDIIEKALSQAKDGREFILRKMNEVIDKPRSNLAPHAPRIQIIHINPEKIGEVIGSGGKVIRSIQEETSTTIAIEPDGSVFISALDTDSMNSAIKIIESIVEEPIVGAIYNGTVVRIQPFGAFVKITHSCEGLLHISEIEHRRINKVEDVLKTGEKVKVKVLAVDPESGKIRLSRKALLKKERTSNINRDDKEYRGNN